MLTFADKSFLPDCCHLKLLVPSTLLMISAMAVGGRVLAQTYDDSKGVDSAVAQAPTLKTSTRLVGVDIIVTDPQGRPVIGLTKVDFNVVEDNVPEVVRDFEAHTIATESNYVPPKIPQLPPNTYLNIIKARESGIPTVILFDALNSPVVDQAYARQQIMRFLKYRPPGTQVAIFVLSDKLRLLQGFTEDTGLLTAALPSRKGTAHITPLLGATIASGPTAGAFSGGDDLVFDEIIHDFAGQDKISRALLGGRRSYITLEALAQIGRFLTPVPGRKNLIWLSSDFPAYIFPSNEPSNRDEFLRTYSVETRQATDMLNLSHVAIYPVDIRGIRVNPNFSTEKRDNYEIIAATNGIFVKTDATDRATMDSLADNTGGHAFYGTNDLEGALNHALTDGSTYYSLSYAPTNPKYDGSLRHIKVTLKKSGYTLAYRKTYYADDLEAAARAAADAPVSPLSPALERGTPLAHGLFVEAHLDAAGTPAPATPAQMQVLAQYAAMQSKKNEKLAPVMMQQYFISYGLIARQLEMSEDDKGAHQASLEFGVIAYDDDGRKLNGLDTRVDDAIPAPRYAKLATDGYHVVQSIAVPVNAASLRLAVRDIHSNRTGSLEVKLPLAKATDAKAPPPQPPAK